MKYLHTNGYKNYFRWYRATFYIKISQSENCRNCFLFSYNVLIWSLVWKWSSRKVASVSKIGSFLKPVQVGRFVIKSLQGFTHALFATTIFHLRLTLKCSWGSRRSLKLWLKQHSNLKPLEMKQFFVISGIVSVLIHPTHALT